ncbi:MAG: hypothetical protein NTX35_15660 [Verrucomicrobia bacterium]|nr:hypothetical protein [Verrucomicrobiota bacterium]
MKTRFQPLPDGEPPLDVKPFLHHLRHDPGFAETMQAHCKSRLATPHSPDTAVVHQAAQAALRTLKHHQGAWKAKQALEQAIQLLDPATGAHDATTLRRLHALADEASNHLLDTQEPERTRLMGSITAIRAAIHSLNTEDS